jgi:hypothetical protein
VFARQAIRRLLDSELAALLVTDADDLLGFVEEYLAVTDGTGCGVGDDSFDDRFNTIVFRNNLNLQLGEKADVILATTVGFSVALLPTVTAHFRHGHAGHAEVLKCFLHSIEPVWPNDRNNCCHSCSSMSKFGW